MNEVARNVAKTQVWLLKAKDGKTTIRNKRYTVDLILDLLAAGTTHAEILEDYPNLEEEDILACLAYAKKISNTGIIQHS